MDLTSPVEPPEDLPPAPPGLGTLTPWLWALARAQGAWPPTPPVVATAPAGLSGWDDGGTAADRLVDGGAGLVVVAGEAPPAPALIVLAVLLRLDPVAAVGTAGGPGWAALVDEVRSGLAVAKDLYVSPRALVERAGADVVAGTAGLIAQSAARRTPVLLGPDPVAVAGAVLASRIAPDVVPWLLGATSAPGSATAKGLTDLKVPVLLDLRSTAALPLALGLLEQVVALTRG